jgi:hypothetical protein
MYSLIDDIVQSLQRKAGKIRGTYQLIFAGTALM